MAMDDKAFREKVIEELNSIHSILIKLTNQDYCNQALLMAMVEQPGLNPDKLEEDYEDNLQHILEQVAPKLQRRETYEIFREGLRMRLEQNRR